MLPEELVAWSPILQEIILNILSAWVILYVFVETHLILCLNVTDAKHSW